MRPPAVFPNGALGAVGGNFEYCQLNENSNDSDRASAGTPIPSKAVVIGPTPTTVAEIVPTPTFGISEAQVATPVFEPTAAPTSEPLALLTQIEVVNVGQFEKNNWHFVFIGVGYSRDENPYQMAKVIELVEKNFEGVDVDFAYIKEPLNLDFNRIDLRVELNSRLEGAALFSKIKTVYPVDSLIIGVNTSDVFGTSARMRITDFSYAILTLSNPSVGLIATHEMGHQLGLSDGYQAYNPPEILPNTELFYLDGMPVSLARALSKLEETPPMYKMGTCNGRKVYTFYETKNNLYGNYSPQEPNSWGDSVFTPLQILIMNDFIARK